MKMLPRLGMAVLALVAVACSEKFEVEDGWTDAADVADQVEGLDCGNSITEDGEECDDGNEIDGDGCDSDCTYSCHESEECVDEDPCNGDEFCGPESHMCEEGTPLEDGTLVDVGPPRVICLEGGSHESICGDGFVDTGAGEFCEPPGEGTCTDECQQGCGSDADCPDDLNLCNGEEYCNMSTSLCDRRNVPEAGTPCDDDAFCTAEDACDAGTCVGTGNTCDDSVDCTHDICDETAESCDNSPVSGWCFVDGTCYADAADHPTDDCLACDVSVDQEDWTFRSGAGCDDGDDCTESDICDVTAGMCVGSRLPALFGVVDVCGANFTCAVMRTGGVKCWGPNTYGQLGIGTTASGTYPQPQDVVGLGTTVTQIACGHNHVCVRTSAGGVKCWGRGGLGQLGDGRASDSPTPVDVSGLGSGVVQVSAGAHHACAVLTTGEVMCWGQNSYGQIGKGDSGSGTNALTPAYVLAVTGSSHLTGIRQVDGGVEHTCAVIDSSGEVLCWGADTHGELGNGATSTADQPRPGYVLVSSYSIVHLTGVDEISTSGYFTCARIGTAVMCWGDNDLGQLGDGSNSDKDHAVDTRYDESGSDVSVARDVEAGADHACIVTTSDTAMCWGDDEYGQLGDGTPGGYRSGANDVLDGSASRVGSFAGMGLGIDHSCGIIGSDEELHCWGRNNVGQLGKGDSGSGTNAYNPTPVLCY